ncbi:MAG: uroporphyrinogen decarboxylase family protein [Christensenellales bacterium]
MTNRQKFIDYVKNGGEKPICSIQIGAGAGFDTKVIGKDWISATTIEDTIAVTQQFDMVPLYNFGLDVLSPSDLAWGTSGMEQNENTHKWHNFIETPFGNLTQDVIEQIHTGVTRTAAPVKGEEDLDAFEWVLDRILHGKNYGKLTDTIGECCKKIGDLGAIDFQWGMQPYEIFGYADTLNTMLMSIDCEDRFVSLMEKCLEISKKIVDCVKAGGGDFCFLGGPAAEMVNPYIYENFIVPYGKKISDHVHSKGLLVYSHVCSPVEPFLTKGYFNQLGIDLFETLSMKPFGNVASIEDAFSKIDNNMCTRGNVGLDKLISGTPDEIYAEVTHIMDMALKMGRKHMVAASDYLMPECKVENVQAMCDAVRDYKIQK